MRNFLILFLISLSLTSCKSQNERVYGESQETKLPLKTVVINRNKDSVYMQLMVPSKIKINNDFNSEIFFTKMQFSQNGGNVFSFKGPKVYEQRDDTLEYKPVKKRYIKSNSFKEYNLYVGYNVFLNTNETDIVLKNANFSNKMKNKEVYNIERNENILEIFNQKIPDSIRGYIHLNYTNPKTEQFDYLNIPVSF